MTTEATNTESPRPKRKYQFKKAAEGEAVATLFLTDAWTTWLGRPHHKSGNPNKERSEADRLNHRRALELFSLGSSGSEDLSNTPITDLALEADTLRARLIEGVRKAAASSKRAAPGQKTVSNLASCLMRVRADLHDLLSLPGVAPKTARGQRKGRRQRMPRQKLLVKDWPASTRADWQLFDAYRTDPFYSGPGHQHRGKVVRETSMVAYQKSVGQYIRYCIIVEAIEDLTLEHLVDFERVLRYRSWYFKTYPVGGYTGFNFTCVALALITRFMNATGRAFPEVRPSDRSADAPWNRLYLLGKSTKANGASSGKLVRNGRVENMTPADLLKFAERVWESTPRGRQGEKESFARKRAAVFFALAPAMPVRRRNWAEMQWGKNLYQDKSGRWVVHFQGAELKVGDRKGETNVYHHELPDWAGEWIERWRQLLADTFGPTFEQECTMALAVQADRDTGRPTPLTATTLAYTISNAGIELLGHDFPMHQVRHIVGTYLVGNSRSLDDAQLAADLLGDKLKTVLDTYYRPDHAKLRREYFSKLTNAD